MTNEPIAYAAVAADGSESVYVTSLKEQAEACCRENGWFLLPLYAAPPTWQEEVAAWWKCSQCGLIVQCMDTVPKDGDDWPAGRACSRCLCGEMVSLWPGTLARPDASEKPFAWAYRKDSSKLVEFSTNRAWPYGMQREFGGEVIPLYRSPTLTDAEREAVRWAVSAASNVEHPAEDALRGLLERCAIGSAPCHANGRQVASEHARSGASHE